ncbi:hypothetical protein RISINGSUN_148 [Erwinia phage vB_EamM_RisingSun]|uniref:Uncharacterized protein n=1 Tax=Erwinia phage vB_EamM_RisingSun TaxID=2026080 RepID=A0A223LHR5_9CAUD|nr:hypothetical protein FDI45_gp148 [Erwinia phage vB_EamM_RisingSun]ASU03522.1 hypothetical protein RISINGSUN_148 [Erwinia phage vB_EamM_RisingSun]
MHVIFVNGYAKTHINIAKPDELVERIEVMPVTGLQVKADIRKQVDDLVRDQKLWVLTSDPASLNPIDPSSRWCRGYVTHIDWIDDTEVKVTMQVMKHTRGAEFNRWQLTAKQTRSREDGLYIEPYVLLF